MGTSTCETQFQSKGCLESCRGTPSMMQKQPENVDEDSGSLLRRFSLKQWIDVIKKVAFVVGGAIIIFAAFRNTLTYHLEKVWGISGDFWQSQWQKIHTFFGEDDFTVGFYGTIVITFVEYWAVCFFFLIIDITGRPAFLLKYKIQEDQNVPVSRKQLLHGIAVVLYNQIFIGVPFMYMVYHLMHWRGCSFGPELPSIQWVLVEATVFLFFEEIGFYYSHRMFHHPRLYRHIHKIHHEWTSPISITAIYCHPVEQLCANLLPTIIGPLLMGSHIATMMLWSLTAQTSAIIAHCGYHFPLLPSPEAHDFHHLKFNNNFGTLGILDRLHGTDNLFRKSKQYQRHSILLGLIPMKETFPEEPVKCEKTE